MKLPMRQKYVDEKTGIYMIFGTRPDGTVDVNDGQQDVFEGLPQDIAEEVVAAHDRFRQELYSLLCE